MKNLETSKLLLLFIMLSYFIVLVTGIVVIIALLILHPEYSIQALIALFSYVGAPVISVTSFYIWKAKGENIFKYLPKTIFEAAKNMTSDTIELMKEFMRML